MSRSNFLKWAEKELEEHYEDRLYEALKAFVEFTEKPKEYVIKSIMAKLNKAVSEYGSPEDNIGKYDINKEVEAEHIDTLGWPLVRDYQSR